MQRRCSAEALNRARWTVPRGLSLLVLAAAASGQLGVCAASIAIVAQLPWGDQPRSVGLEMGPGILGHGGPADFDVDAEGCLWVLDTVNQRVLRVGSEGSPVLRTLALPRNMLPDAVGCVGTEAVVLLQPRPSARQHHRPLSLLWTVGAEGGQPPDTRHVTIEGPPPGIDYQVWTGAERYFVWATSATEATVVNEVRHLAASYDCSRYRWTRLSVRHPCLSVRADPQGTIYRLVGRQGADSWSLCAISESRSGTTRSISVEIPAPPPGEASSYPRLLGCDASGRWIVTLDTGPDDRGVCDLVIYAFSAQGELVGRNSLLAAGLSIAETLKSFDVRHKIGSDGNVYLCLPTLKTYRIAKVTF